MGSSKSHEINFRFSFEKCKKIGFSLLQIQSSNEKLENLIRYYHSQIGFFCTTFEWFHILNKLNMWAARRTCTFIFIIFSNLNKLKIIEHV